MERLLDVDEFVADLWKVHLRVKEEGYAQDLSLGLFRSDYMVHENDSVLQAKQVEFNTIASSFGGLSMQTSLLHRYLAATEYPLLQHGWKELDVPKSDSVEVLARGMATAFREYSREGTAQRPTCVVFIIQEGERNVFDQRHLEYQLASSDPPIPVFRLPFAQVLQHTRVAEGARRELIYTLPWTHEWPQPSEYEVAVVYLRAGYGPGDYPSAEAWDARYQIERSRAIKCPTILTQLAGMKKVQQVLATPGDSAIHDRFIKSLPDAGALTDTFTNIYPMDASAAGLEARKKATDPELCKNFVLKPQREGGGNNTYRTAIPDFLASIPETHWASYILMELITPPSAENIILRNGQVEEGGIISELGVYGTCLWKKGGEVLHNGGGGYLLRTKGDKSEEGGVAAGFGCMDSVSLVD
ncbi:glutathione synthase [Candidatus Bathyarchaeota archaeon]|nr:glutathione synthase [Candidatus Bathyarchaeota archaeon]